MKTPRCIRPGALYLVTVRTNGGAKYLSTPLAKDMFLETLTRLKTLYSCRIDNFVILDDHVHLLILPLGESTLAVMMRWLLGVYTMRYNRAFDSWGHLWGSRYHSRPVSGLAERIRVFTEIDHHPVRSGLVERAEDWAWGGFRQYRSGSGGIVDDPPEWLTFTPADRLISVEA